MGRGNMVLFLSGNDKKTIFFLSMVFYEISNSRREIDSYKVKY